MAVSLFRHRINQIVAALVVAAFLCSGTKSFAQDGESLGEIARKNRQRQTADSTTPKRVLTTEDVATPDPSMNVTIPDIPNLVRCAKNEQCFLENIDKGIPAFLTRTETEKPLNDGIITATISWWTTSYSGNTATLSFRVEDFKARINEAVFENRTEQARKERESKIAEAIRDFEKVRKQDNTCTLSRRDLKAVLTSSAMSLMTIGPATNLGKSCTGAMFVPTASLPPAKQTGPVAF